jgi:hypothetical protein
MDPFMVFWIFLIGIIIGIIIASILIQRTAIVPLHKEIDKLTRKIQSLSRKTTFMPPPSYSPENFRNLSTPIDGIQFENDTIIFIQSKSPKSRLTPLQKPDKTICDK